jgi:hypothetical protein
MTIPIGKHLPRAKPVAMTFYDSLIECPYRTTFYVREDTSDEDCHRLIEAVCAVSVCALGQYTVGYQKYVLPDYREKLKDKRGIMGTFKWQITFHSPEGRPRRHTIPGWNVELSLTAKTPGLRKTGDRADRDHPLWQAFLTVFTELCVTQEGKPIIGHIEVDRTASNWPPKGWRKHR